MQRISRTLTINASASQPIIVIGSSSTGTIGEVLFVDCIQIEQKSFATSFVNGTRDKGLLAYPNPLERQFTVSFWAFMNTVSGGGVNNNKCFVSLTDSSQDFQFFLARFTDGNLAFWGRKTDGTVNTLIPTTTQITLNTWHYIVLTCNGSNVKLYHNGMLVGETNVFDIDYVTNLPLMHIGSENPDRHSYSSRRLLNGLIDELRIDKIERTADEIAAWYYCNSPFWPRGIYRKPY